MTTTTTQPAPTTAQLDYLRDLLATRQIPENVKDAAELAMARDLNKLGASRLIDMLKGYPRNPWKPSTPEPGSPLAPVHSAAAELQAKLAEVPKSRYAIPVADVDMVLQDTPLHGDLLFIEIREYRGALYMRRLTGAPGGFIRWKVSAQDAKALVDIIKVDPYEHTRRFGLHYSCCGKCGAELTDPVSRKYQLGPDCRRAFGIS